MGKVSEYALDDHKEPTCCQVSTYSLPQARVSILRHGTLVEKGLH